MCFIGRCCLSRKDCTFFGEELDLGTCAVPTWFLGHCKVLYFWTLLKEMIFSLCTTYLCADVIWAISCRAAIWWNRKYGKSLDYLQFNDPSTVRYYIAPKGSWSAPVQGLKRIANLGSLRLACRVGWQHLQGFVSLFECFNRFREWNATIPTTISIRTWYMRLRDVCHV